MFASFDERLVFFDIETAGFFDIVAGQVEVTRPIIQIAAIAIDRDDRDCETFEVKVQFDEADADPGTLCKNHYDGDIWSRHALPPTVAAARFAAFLRRHATVDRLSHSGKPYRLAQLVAHNAERFDGPLIHAWFRQLDRFCPATYSVYCTKQRAYWLFQEHKQLTPPPDFQLTTLCQYFAVPLREEEWHDAINDVWATVELYRAMRQFERDAVRNVPSAA